MKYILIVMLVLTAGLLAFFGLRTIKVESSIEGKVTSAAGMAFFVAGLLYLAWKLYESPLM